MHQFRNCIFNTVFIDIETVSQKRDWEDLSPSMKNLWSHKTNSISRYQDLNLTLDLEKNLYHKKAAIYAEFGKIICISIGMFYRRNGEVELYRKSFCGDSEQDLLEDFLKLVAQEFNDSNRFYFCGHNIREFDVPYICRRALVNGLKLPSTLQISGKKSWQLQHFLDTLQLWKFGDYKHYTSLSLMCELFDIASPKDKMDGAQVGTTYYDEEDLDKIRLYCEQDVKAVAYLFAKMIGREDIEKSVTRPVEIRNLEKVTTAIAS